MKKILSLILVMAICLSLCACGKSKAAKECEELIAAIGAVSLDSKDAIEAAERAYSALTTDEKDSISSSGAILNDAIAAYYLECCKLIYSTLKDADEIVSQFGDDLYVLGNATKTDYTFPRGEFYHLKYLLNQVSIHLTEDEMRQGIEGAIIGHNLLDGCDADVAVYVANLYHVLGDLCLLGVSNAYKITNSVTEARETLYNASVMMAEVRNADSCAKHYLILEKYYEAIEEYLEICLDCDSIGQISQFGDMRNSYLGYTETYTSDLDALLAK